MSFPVPTAKQGRVIWIAVTGVGFAIIVGLAAGLVWGLGKSLHLLAPVLWPIAVAGILAYLLDPVVDFMARRGVPRTRAIMQVFGLAVTIILGIAGAVIPQVVRELQEASVRMPAYTARIEKKVEQWVNNPPWFLKSFVEHTRNGDAPPLDPGAPTSIAITVQPAPLAQTPEKFWQEVFGEESFKSFSTWVARSTGRAAVWLFGVIAGLALVPVYAFYFLQEKAGITGHWTDYLPVRRGPFKEELIFVLSAINDYLIHFFRGQVIVAFINGILYTIGFLLIGLPYAVALGALVVPLTMVPFFGVIVTTLTALLISFVSYGDWQHPAMVLAVVAVAQSIEVFVVQPKIIGDRVGLHPLSIIIALMAGTTLLGGVLGGLLAIPLTAALRVIMFRYVWLEPDGSQTSMMVKPKNYVSQL